MNYSYRDSHSSPEYGERYARTYSQGYYYEQWVKLERPLLKEILKKRIDCGASSCLDFACGTGRILSVVEEMFSVTHGVDVSDSMLKIAREKCKKAAIEKRDLTQRPLGKRFDVITAFRFFLNAETSLRNEALLSIYNHLNENGVLVVNCHVNKWSPLGFFYRFREAVWKHKKANTLSLAEFKEILEINSFQIQSVHRYSYLPRTGWHLQWIPRLLMLPFERFVKKITVMPDWMAQSFILVCKKEGKPSGL